jgi:hypothetical protein
MACLPHQLATGRFLFSIARLLLVEVEPLSLKDQMRIQRHNPTE